MDALSNVMGAQPQQDLIQASQEQQGQESNTEVMATIANLLNSVVDQKTYDSFKHILKIAGVDASELPDIFDPAVIEEGKREMGLEGAVNG